MSSTLSRHKARIAGPAVAVGLGVVTLAPAAFAADVTNGGFESDKSGWAPTSGTTFSITTSSPHSGSKAAALSRTSASGGAGITDSPNQFTQVPVGSTCTATAWVKGPSGLKGNLKWFALNGTTKVLTVAKSVTFNGAWQQIPTATLTMPSGASTADLQVIAPSFPTGSTWYVDDVVASCSGSAPPPPPPTSGYVGHWAFNESGTPSTAADSSGKGNNGNDFNITGNGQYYSFNGSSSRVIVPENSSLDPGSADFSYGVTLKMAAGPVTGETYDVLRKGLTTTTGGDYKLEISNSNGLAVARCIVKDAQKVAAIIRAGSVDLADNQWHDVTCSRSGNSVTITIDGTKRGTKTVSVLGTVSNAADLAVGAKAEGTAPTGFDWFLGLIDDAWVRID